MRAEISRLLDLGLRVGTRGEKLLVAPGTAVDDALRAWIREHKPQLIAEARAWVVVEAAINALCDAREESDANRVVLLTDAWRRPAVDWPAITNWCRTVAALRTH